MVSQVNSMTRRSLQLTKNKLQEKAAFQERFRGMLDIQPLLPLFLYIVFLSKDGIKKWFCL